MPQVRRSFVNFHVSDMWTSAKLLTPSWLEECMRRVCRVLTPAWTSVRNYPRKVSQGRLTDDWSGCWTDWREGEKGGSQREIGKGGREEDLEEGRKEGDTLGEGKSGGRKRGRVATARGRNERVWSIRNILDHHKIKVCLAKLYNHV